MLKRKQLGFSMIEVMVAVVVLVFGVLGMAGLQLQAISATEQGRYNSRAAMQATSVAAAIKANPGYWVSASGLISVSGGTITNGPASHALTCAAGSGGSVCLPVQMAYYDLAKVWGPDIASALPLGTLQVNCTPGSAPSAPGAAPIPSVCTVTVFWYEKNVAVRNQDAGSGNMAADGASQHSYQTVVSPIQKLLTL